MVSFEPLQANLSPDSPSKLNNQTDLNTLFCVNSIVSSHSMRVCCALHGFFVSLTAPIATKSETSVSKMATKFFAQFSISKTSLRRSATMTNCWVEHQLCWSVGRGSTNGVDKGKSARL